MYDQDPDVLRWGLDLLCGDPFLNSGYCAATTIYYDGEQDNLGTDCAIVQNDELIAHSLQQEFSQFAVSEASGSSRGDDELPHASVLEHDWFGQFLFDSLLYNLKLLEI